MKSNLTFPLPIFIVLVVFFFSVQKGIAQGDTTQTTYKILTRGDFIMTELYIQAAIKMVKMKTNLYGPEADEFRKNCDLNDTISRPLTDSTVIFLTSGLSWSDVIGPPEAPKNFNFKLLSKKGRSKPGMQERIQFLEFVSRCNKEDGLANDMIDRIEVYNTIVYADQSPCLHVVYSFIPREGRGFKFDGKVVEKL